MILNQHRHCSLLIYDNINKLNKMIAYLWHNVPGLQKFGVYKDGGTNGWRTICRNRFPSSNAFSRPFAETGIANNGGWYILHVQNDSITYNDDSAVIKPAQQITFVSKLQEILWTVNDGQAGIDILSNGFKLQSDTTGYKHSGSGTYIYVHGQKHQHPTCSVVSPTHVDK